MSELRKQIIGGAVGACALVGMFWLGMMASHVSQPAKPPATIGFATVAPRNLPRLCLVKKPVNNNHLGPKALGLADSAPKDRAALATLKRWAPGQTLTYAFSGGTVADRQELVDAANTWMKVANIRLVQTDKDPADIRILIDDSGSSWSFVGRDIISAGPEEPTMVIGWRDDLGRSIHEWGHVLGLIHNQQIPENGLKWNIARLKSDYNGAPNYWTDAQIYDQIINPSTETLAPGYIYDKFSIMAYAIPESELLDKTQAVPWNTTLSPTDIAQIGGWLPFPK